MSGIRIRYYIEETKGVELIKSNASGIRYPPHNHVSVYTLGMVLQGNVLLHLGGKQFSLSVNDTYMVPPYVAHSLVATMPCSLLCLCVGRRFFDAPKERLPFDEIAGLLARAFEEGGANDRQLLLFWDFLQHFRNYERRSADRHGPVAQLSDMIAGNPEHPLTGREMADEVAHSRFHLIRKFKSEIGLSPHQFQLQNRVRKAQRLLREPFSLAEIALRAGFCDQSHLTRCFEKIVGLPPGAYRRSVVVCKRHAH